MAKPITQKIKLLSTAGTGFFYVTKKNHGRQRTRSISGNTIQSPASTSLSKKPKSSKPLALIFFGAHFEFFATHRLSGRRRAVMLAQNHPQCRLVPCTANVRRCRTGLETQMLRWEMVAGVGSDIGSGVEVRAAPAPACQVMD